ncbi:hypothetical protein ACWC2T_42960 [Streptomyces sp. NPDC001393]
MRVDVIQNGEAALASVADAEDLKSLAVVVGPGVSDETLAGALTAGGLGSLDGQHAWLSVAALRSAGEDSDAWRSGFTKMIEFATSRGWTNESGNAVRAHVERAGSDSA